MMSIFLLAAAAPGAAPAAPGPPDGLVPLKDRSGGGGQVRCTPPGGDNNGQWCVAMAKDPGSPLIILHQGKEVGRWTPSGDEENFEVVPGIFPLADGRALAIVTSSRNLMYSGGGGTVTTQHIILTRPGNGISAAEVLAAPGDSGVMIRACFSEQDMKQRAGACHDEYSMSAKLAFVPADSGMPAIRLETEATSFPRGVSRDKDSLALPRLRKKDLVHQIDRACSYKRVFRFDAAQKQYVPDAALPDCSQYLDG